MFGIGSWELAVVVLVVLVVFGPQRLPELARILGEAMRMFRRASDELRRNLDLSDMPNPRDFRIDLDELEPRYEREYKKRFQRRASETEREDSEADESYGEEETMEEGESMAEGEVTAETETPPAESASEETPPDDEGPAAEEPPTTEERPS